MPRRGENIHKRKDGRWEGRFLSVKEVNGKRVYQSVYGKTYQEVKRKLQEKKCMANETSIMLHSSAKTVEMVAEEWLSEIRQKRKYSTFVKYESIYTKHIQKYIRDMSLEQISAELFLDILKQEYNRGTMLSEGLSDSTIRSIKSVFCQILRYGDRDIALNSRNTLPNRSSNNVRFSNEISVFTANEQTRLISYLRQNTDSYKLGILVCLLTGIRLGEICALETNDIQLENKRIMIHRTVQRIKTTDGSNKTSLYITPPKTHHSRREIPICTTLETILKDHMEQKKYLVNGDKPMEPRTYQYMFARFLKYISLEKKNFHSLRHTFATNCIDSGMDPKCLSEILGHSDVNTTLNKYVHPTLAMKQKQMDSFACYCGQILGQ